MDPRDFLKTAAHLKDQDGEHNMRTSISRSYYAVHLHIRHFISEKFLGGKKFTSSPHEQVLRCLQFSDAKDIKKIGETLSYLRQDITDAGYKMAKKITSNKCQDVYDEANDLLSEFESTIAIASNKQMFAKSSIARAKNEGLF